MRFSKTYPNGLKLIINRIDGLLSVSCGVLVKTGSANESSSNNGISHFIEHNLFKGTKTRSAFNISDDIDSIGAQINAFTSKELTCYYTKSTSEHLEKTLEVLSDIFFNSVFDEKEMEREKQVILEEINMVGDSPEEICFDLLAKAYYGNTGYGRTILGSAKNVSSFTKDDVLNYMDKYYTADNVCISIAGNVDIEKTVKLIDKYFDKNFTGLKSDKQKQQKDFKYNKLYKFKKTEQTHLAFSTPAFSMSDDKSLSASILNIVLGGGMSSRLFQKIREEMGLAYSVYSYISQYKNHGSLEIYAGVGNGNEKKAFDAIINEVNKLRIDGVSKKEFLRGKEQVKSSFVLGQESTSSQMLIAGKYLLFLGEEFDFERRIQNINEVTIEEVNNIASKMLSLKDYSTAVVGPIKNSILI